MRPVFFQLWESNRLYIIREHRFYVAEGRKRLTDQFSDSDQLSKVKTQMPIVKHGLKKEVNHSTWTGMMKGL